MSKFNRKADVTYLDLFRETFRGEMRLARLMEKELGKTRAHELLYRSRVKGDLELISMQLNGKKPAESFTEFKTLMKRLHETPAARNMFTITYPVDNDKEIVFLTKECILAEVFKEIGASDLGYIMCCQPDFETTPAYCPSVYLKRSKTLMKGDDCCDTTYCWKKQ
ncbi:L-2-amino-thiazoline-4-carboxylic acid hydrolase [Candidatus Bathyarchaeota archaeon]|nr:L-2-amino-thiazoline-4-carboxylic acid hydrolase [Candidatus Bathyarchaeota archaeon]